MLRRRGVKGRGWRRGAGMSLGGGAREEILKAEEGRWLCIFGEAS